MSAPAKGPPHPSPAPVDLYFGERIGKYQVIAQLSVGGMAELFLGFTSGPGGFRKYVALKRILPDARSNEQFEKMFLDEARITAALNHPHIAQVFELGQDAEGLFLAMEFIAGQNLNQVAGVCRRRGQALPTGFSLSVVRDVCLALHSAHTFTTPGGKPYPVIHRDVSQKNVMVTYDGVVKLLDFGIAKARDGGARTQVGMVKGTTGYMSPEQVRGEPLDARSDLFAAGVMLHEMLTGERLFAGDSEQHEMKLVLDGPIPVPSDRVPEVPREVSAVVLQALARNKDERYPNGREMAKAIEQAAGPLLFDAEQRAAFMREHFQDRMQVTRRLLESVDGPQGEVDSGTARMLGGGEDLEPTEQRAPAPAPARDEATRVKAPAEAKRPARSEAPAGGPAPVVTTGRKVTRDRALDTREVAAATREHPAERKGGTWKVLLAVAVVGGGLGFGGMKLAEHLKAAEPPPLTRANVEELTRMRPLDAPRSTKKEPAPVANPGTPADDARTPEDKPLAADAQDGKEAQGGTKKSGDGEPTRSGKQGALTLIILPEAEVFLNGHSLGKTPLFKTAVPVGKHLLRIKGADGKRRVLSVPVEAGKTAQFRLKLSDIPEG